MGVAHEGHSDAAVNQGKCSMTFEEMVRLATDGLDPYQYQCEIADDGFPELLAVPTGAGKTMAAVLPWVYRRRFHSDGKVKSATPTGVRVTDAGTCRTDP
jgi:hypothetical protein